MTSLPQFLSSPTVAFSLTGWQLWIKGCNHHSYRSQVAEYFHFVAVAAPLSNKPVSRRHLLIAEVWLDAYAQCCTHANCIESVLCGLRRTQWCCKPPIILTCFLFWFLSTRDIFIQAKIKYVPFSFEKNIGENTPFRFDRFNKCREKLSLSV